MKIQTIQGERLRECLEEKKMTQVELSEITHYSKQHINNIITGKRNMSLSSASTFANILGVLADYLLGNCSYKTNSERRSQTNEDRQKQAETLYSFFEMNDLKVTKLLLLSDEETFSIDPINCFLPYITTEKWLLRKQVINDKEVEIKEIQIFATLNNGEERQLDVDVFFQTKTEILNYSNYICRDLIRKSYSKYKFKKNKS